MTGPDPRRHHGLGVERYVQATSPIRRYGDLVVQRQLASFLRNGAPFLDRAQLDALGPLLDKAARRTGLAERDRRDYWILKHLARTAERPREALVLGEPERGRALVELQDCLFRAPVRFRGNVRPGDVVAVRVGGVDLHALRARIWEANESVASEEVKEGTVPPTPEGDGGETGDGISSM